MSRNTTSISFLLPLAAIGLGAGLWTIGASNLRGGSEDKDPFNYEPNVAAINGSPIGKTIALAVQGTVDYYWHEGASNPFEAHDHSSCGSGCGDPACGHDHHDHASHDHGGDCEHGTCDHDKHQLLESESEKSAFALFREHVEAMDESLYEGNSAYEMSELHRRYIHSKVEQKLEFAYKLDPVNFLNYNTLHLFYETSLGNGIKSPEELIELAKETYEKIPRDGVDPEPWLTAAATRNNICEVIVNYPEVIKDPAELVSLIDDMRDCLIKFATGRNERIEAGTWEQIPVDRREQMETRFSMMLKLHEAQVVIFHRKFANPDIANPRPALVKSSPLAATHF